MGVGESDGEKRKTLVDYIFHGGIAGKKFIDPDMRSPNNVYEVLNNYTTKIRYLNGKELDIYLGNHFLDKEATLEEVKRAREEIESRNRLNSRLESEASLSLGGQTRVRVYED